MNRFIFKKFSSKNPFSTQCYKQLKVNNESYNYYSINSLGSSVGIKNIYLDKLPYSIKILLESALRNCDDFSVKKTDVERIVNWKTTSKQDVEIPFKPARVVLQDFTGVPGVVDLAAMRDVFREMGKDPKIINPLIPTELVIDHSVQADFARVPNADVKNMDLEFSRNRERFQFLKWGQNAFRNFTIVPPGSGIVHQVNLEYLGRIVFNENKLLYPDTLVGADSHTTMINGLGIVGWGVGGIEAEAAMLGQTISMVLPEVIGVRLTGKLQDTVNATDLVLTVTEMLRKRGVVGKFVEFFGPGAKNLQLSDRATVANMCPEYGATIGYFPVDEQTLDYMKLTGRTQNHIDIIHNYMKANSMFADSGRDPEYGEVLELDLSKIVNSIAGPKRPQDRVALTNAKKDFNQALVNKIGFKGFGLNPDQIDKKVTLKFDNKDYEFGHGSTVIAAITSCTNTSNPEVMLAAGLLAKKADQLGLKVKPYIKTTLSPGSGVVRKYFEEAGLLKYLENLGFNIAGYGCMTCIGNSGELHDNVIEAITKNDIVSSSVLSGNRNFEGRVHNLVRSNYLMSPPLVVAYALAGTVNIDFEKEPLGVDKNGNNVFLKDIWPGREEITKVMNSVIRPKMFNDVYDLIAKGTDQWNSLEVSKSDQFDWDSQSTYIRKPPFFDAIKSNKSRVGNIKDARCLLLLGDSITTDHISPAGGISKKSAAAKFLNSKGVEQKDFNQYGTRRGNYEIMARGTFANVRIVNKLISETGPNTIHHDTGKISDVYEISQTYIKDDVPLIVIAGKEYGSGSSRDWAAKGPMLLGIKIVIAESYERIHRSNLVGMGILPLEFTNGESAEKLGLTGKEKFSFHIGDKISIGQIIQVTTDTGKSFKCKARIDTEPEIEYYKDGGILIYVMKKLMQ